MSKKDEKEATPEERAQFDKDFDTFMAGLATRYGDKK